MGGVDPRARGPTPPGREANSHKDKGTLARQGRKLKSFPTRFAQERFIVIAVPNEILLAVFALSVLTTSAAASLHNVVQHSKQREKDILILTSRIYFLEGVFDL